MPTTWRPDRPFNDLPTLPPGQPLETREVLKRCIAARAAVAELKQSAEQIPNPAILIGTLPLLEARASSEIENVVTTTDRLFRHLSAEGAADPATKEALRYRYALLSGFGTLDQRPLSTRTAELICSRIMGVEMGVRRVPGTVLRNQVSGEAVYTPPENESRLRDLLSNWERFLHADDDLDPLVRMAVAHYQFEAIHPFTDGNGRTGRVLNSLFFVERHLLSLPILYLSRSIIARKSDYYRLLFGVTADGDWEPWVLFMLDCVEDAAVWTHAKIAAVGELLHRTAEHVRRARPKIYSRELVELVFVQPYCRINDVVDAGIVARQAASRYLRALASIGVLDERPAGRERLFVNTRLMELLTRDE